jgi:hypothetical protein
MSLVNELIKGLLPEEENKQTTAVYAGGFKPPTSGHFEVVKEALKENPEIDEFIIFVGNKERNGITQAESVLIWEIYNDYLPLKVKIVPTSKPPIQAVYNFSKDHPTREVLWVIGAREGNEEDFKDITSRTKSISNYPNLELRTIITAGGVSGTAARNAAQVSFEKFKKFAPDVLSNDEKYEVYELVSGKVAENKSFSQMNKIDQIKSELKYFTETNLVLDFSTKDPFKDKVVVYPDFQGVDVDEDIIGTEKILNVTDCIGNEPYKDYKYFTTTKKEYVEKMIKNASGDGWKSFDPIVVVPHPILNGKYSVIDGNHRLGAFVIGNLPKINTKILSEDQILLAVPGTKWDENTLPKTIPLKDSKGKVNLKKYFATQPLKVPTNINEDFPLIVLHGDKIDTTFKFNQDLIESTSPTPILVNNINLHKTTKFDDDKIKSLKSSISNKESIPPIIVREHNNQYQILDGHHRYVSYKELDKKYIDAVVLTQNQVIEISSSEELDLIYEKIFSKYPDFRKFNYSPYIASLTQHMIDKGMKLEPLPQIQMVHDDIENGEDIFGKTAYYAPQTNIIVLFTYGRHPKDILRSYAHELVHVHQNMEDRLETINTTDVNQDDHLEQLEREAYETGNIMFRSWTDSITGNKLNEEIKIDESLPPINRLYKDLEKIKHNFFSTILTEGKKKNKDPFGLMAYAHELGRLREEESEYKVYLDMDGVLADFDKRFKDLSGIGPSEFESKYGKNKFWDFIDEEHKVSFWVGIEPMPGAADLVNAVKDYNYELLTSPSVKKQSYLGKILWVRNHTGDIFPSKPRINFKKAKEKHEIKSQLSKTDILIDDREDTIGRWNAAGGTGIVYKNISQVLNDLAKLGL